MARRERSDKDVPTRGRSKEERDGEVAVKEKYRDAKERWEKDLKEVAEGPKK